MPQIQANVLQPNATITVFIANTTTLATIYSDNNLTALANPFTADSTGNWSFFAASGDYDVQFSGAGIPVPFKVTGLGQSTSILVSQIVLQPAVGGTSRYSLTVDSSNRLVVTDLVAGTTPLRLDPTTGVLESIGGVNISTTGNTQLTLHSPTVGAKDHILFIDSSGGFGITDVVAGTNPLYIGTSGTTTLQNAVLQTPGQTSLALQSTGAGIDNYQLSIDASGNFLIKNLTTGVTNLLTAATGVTTLGGSLTLQSAAQTELILQSTATGYNTYFLAIDSLGDFVIKNVTTNITNLSIAPSGVVSCGQGLNIGQTFAIAGFNAVSVTVTIPSTPAQSSSDTTATATGFHQGYPVSLAANIGIWTPSGQGFYVAQCNAANQVTIRFINPTTAAINPGTGTFILHQFFF